MMALRPLTFLRAGILVAAALLATGCSTAARQALMETRPVLEPTAEARAALQGRAFRVGTVVVDIDVPEPKPLHILPDDAYATMLKAKLEQAFAGTSERLGSYVDNTNPLTEGQQPAYTVDVTIKRMRFITWHEKWDLDNSGQIELRAQARDETGKVVLSLPFLFGAGETWGHTIEDPREAHGDLIPGAAGMLTIALHFARSGGDITKPGPAAANITRYHHDFGFYPMTRTETEALTGLRLDAIPLPAEAEMDAARNRDAISLEAQRPERLTAAVVR